MAEDEISHEQLEAFREEFRGHLGDALFIVGTEQETAFPIDTLSFDMGEETEAELPNSFRVFTDRPWPAEYRARPSAPTVTASTTSSCRSIRQLRQLLRRWPLTLAPSVMREWP